MCVNECVSKEMSNGATNSEHWLVERCPESKVGKMAFANASWKYFCGVQAGWEQASELSPFQVSFFSDFGALSSCLVRVLGHLNISQWGRHLCVGSLTACLFILQLVGPLSGGRILTGRPRRMWHCDIPWKSGPECSPVSVVTYFFTPLVVGSGGRSSV